MTISENVNRLQAGIDQAKAQSASSSQKVTLICVSKYHTVDEAMAVYQAGVRNFAENRVEGFLEKKAAMPKDITWHLIGSLQTRKVKDVINQVDLFHALDRIKLAKEINKRADHVIDCLVQVNVSGEASKHGLAPDQLLDFIDQLADYPKIRVQGLMTMAPAHAGVNDLHKYFSQLRQLGQQVVSRQLSYAPCQELSMGMSGDYPVAIAEGATMVRIGSAFFQKETIND
ncbi:YggS family pyridoxal phosphate enzyme [Aerococcus urinaehominis]|uniref:Pyridoxal phosphate homeostasis protein n=1 Tax=Aerococcus urinaehominis TaxID=128944 RepID=A0A0X8FLU6_9LACT|nr:YggS family pyridoxal phosphate-dependent enzyme [Aerococcus urinaehominis]AMB99665.1 YggS family pyridoxal phosphate enzyme [Aerococcus urinaehominis]SDL89527.1 hypothetical protein SAMN04487985_102113 [Aerococcus urinaehominis]